MSECVQQVRRLTEHWRFLPRVEVVGDFATRAPGADGLYRAGGIYLRDDLAAPRAAEVLAHEAVHHASRRAMGPSAWSSFMAAVADGARQGDPMLRGLFRHVRGLYAEDGLNGVREADEAVARLAELRIEPESGRFIARRPVAARMRAAMAHFAREWLLLPLPATGEEVEGALLHLEDRLRHGTGWCYSGAMPTKPMGPSRPAVDLEESLEMYRAASSGVKMGWKNTLWHWGMGLVGFGLVVFFLVATFDTTIWLAGPIAGVPLGLIFLWAYFRRG
jgi:hypothetical protein